MFEQRIEDTTATVHVDERESLLADEHGVKVPAGTIRLTFAQASELVLALDRALVAGRFCYVHLEKRLRGLRNSIIWAFGPEAEDAMRRSPPTPGVRRGMDRQTEKLKAELKRLHVETAERVVSSRLDSVVGAASGASVGRGDIAVDGGGGNVKQGVK